MKLNPETFGGKIATLFPITMGFLAFGYGILSFLVSFLPSFFHLPEINSKGIFILLGGILAYLGLEKRQLKSQITDKIDNVKKTLEEIKKEMPNLPCIDVLNDNTKIIEDMGEAVKKANINIKVAIFTDAQTADAYRKYFEKLKKRLEETEALTYKCCYGENVSNSVRKEVFRRNTQKLFYNQKNKADILNRMTYYRLEKQTCFNLLIVDEEVAFISFPTQEEHDKIHFSIKITSKNDMGRLIIKKLTHWYEQILLDKARKQKTDDFFS